MCQNSVLVGEQSFDLLVDGFVCSCCIFCLLFDCVARHEFGQEHWLPGDFDVFLDQLRVFRLGVVVGEVRSEGLHDVPNGVGVLLQNGAGGSNPAEQLADLHVLDVLVDQKLGRESLAVDHLLNVLVRLDQQQLYVDVRGVKVHVWRSRED